MSVEILNNSELTSNYTVLKSKNRTLILSPINGLNKKLMLINVYNEELKRTDFKLIENDEDLIFINLLTGQENVFDLSELNLGKIHFRYPNGLCETFEATDLKPSDDLQQYLA